MEIVKTIIIDDESIARRRVLKLLQRHPTFEIIAEVDNGKVAYDQIINLEPDVIFLDIEMPVMSGIELVEKLPKSTRPIIVFITAYNNYAVQAFNFFALDYLLKPFTEERFDKTIKRIKTLLNNESKIKMAHQFERFLDFMNNPEKVAKPQEKKLPVSLGNKIYFIDIEQIQYIVADGNYLNIFANNTKHVIRETLGAIEKKLDRDQLIRIHKSFIINLEFIKEIRKISVGNYEVCMTDSRRFKISKTYKSDVLKRLRL